MKLKDKSSELALAALKEAVKDVIKQHKKDDRPLAVWEDGRVKYIKPWKNKKTGK